LEELAKGEKKKLLKKKTLSPLDFISQPFPSYLGVWWIEFQFLCLWTRFVSQAVVCLHGVGFEGSWKKKNEF
jgi:hypothetical protein